jgi:hypothetical protein
VSENRRYAEVVSPPVARFVPARLYFSGALTAAALCLFSAAWAVRWWPSVIPSALFACTGFVLYYLASRPAIEIHEHWLRIGNDMIPWQDIRRLDRTRWNSPLAVYLTLIDDRRVALLFPGDGDACSELLRFLRRNSREALIDGVPYRQFWGEVLPSSKEQRQIGVGISGGSASGASPKYRIVRPEEEEEIERMLQRLKTVGNLDSKSSDES